MAPDYGAFLHKSTCSGIQFVLKPLLLLVFSLFYPGDCP
jgi:hypothetical protein